MSLGTVNGMAAIPCEPLNLRATPEAKSRAPSMPKTTLHGLVTFRPLEPASNAQEFMVAAAPGAY